MDNKRVNNKKMNSEKVDNKRVDDRRVDDDRINNDKSMNGKKVDNKGMNDKRIDVSEVVDERIVHKRVNERTKKAMRIELPEEDNHEIRPTKRHKFSTTDVQINLQNLLFETRPMFNKHQHIYFIEV